jgi:hypothetical protein
LDLVAIQPDARSPYLQPYADSQRTEAAERSGAAWAKGAKGEATAASNPIGGTISGKVTPTRDAIVRASSDLVIKILCFLSFLITVVVTVLAALNTVALASSVIF